MKKTIIPILILTAILTQSCMPSYYYQVFNVKSASETTDTLMTYSDSQTEISYNFWSKGGNAGFIFKNTGDKDVFIDLSKCFLIINGVAYDYYQNRIFGDSKGSIFTSNSFFAPSLTYTVSSESNLTTYYMEAKTVCVPAHSMKYIACEYPLHESLFHDCDLQLFPKSNSHWDKVTKTTVYEAVPSLHFNVESSPLVFSNIITYYTESPEQCIRIVNEFFVSEITNYPEKQIIKSGDPKNICGEMRYVFEEVNTQAAPGRFYNRYEYNSQTY